MKRRKSKAQKVVEKRLYDMAYREKNREMLKAKKAAYFRRTYDPVVTNAAKRPVPLRIVEFVEQ